MIAWIYSVAGFDTVVTRAYQNFQSLPKRPWTLLIAPELLLTLCVMVLYIYGDSWVSNEYPRALWCLMAPPRASEFAGTIGLVAKVNPVTEV